MNTVAAFFQTLISPEASEKFGKKNDFGGYGQVPDTGVAGAAGRVGGAQAPTCEVQETSAQWTTQRQQLEAEDGKRPKL